jgi:serine protease
VASSAGGVRYGVAKRANLIDVRVLGDDGRGSSSGYVAGLDWAVRRARSRGRTAVMNASLGFSSGSSSVDRATTTATSTLLCVVAAGNGSTESCRVSPARASGVLSVGNAQRDNRRRSSSNYGDCTHIFGPGTSIVAATHRDNSGTRTLTGTSMAAPHVAGVAALYLADNPSLSPSALRSRVVSTGRSGSVSDARGTNLYARYTC